MTSPSSAARPARSVPASREIVAALVAHPRLWSTTAVLVAVLARPGWWRRWPPIPRPDERYLRFRLETAYGDAQAEIVASDVIEYVAWCHEARLAAR
jgi:hypothetical protein